MKGTAGTKTTKWASSRVKCSCGAHTSDSPSCALRRVCVGRACVDASSRQSCVQGWSTLTVRDMMTAPALSLTPNTSVMEAMAFLVEHRISGMPVCDETGRVVGVCSGYDLLALDSTPGKVRRDARMRTRAHSALVGPRQLR